MGLGWDPGSVPLPPPVYQPFPMPNLGADALSNFFGGPQAVTPVTPAGTSPQGAPPITIGNRFQSQPPGQQNPAAGPQAAPGMPPAMPPAPLGPSPALSAARGYTKPLSGVGSFLADLAGGGQSIQSTDPMMAFIQGLSGAISAHGGRAAAERQYADTAAQRDFENKMKQRDMELSQSKLDAEIGNRKDTLDLGRERNDIAAANALGRTDPNSPANKANASRANYYDARAANVGGGGAPTISELNAAQQMAISQTNEWAKALDAAGTPPSSVDRDAHQAKLVDDQLAFNRRAMNQPPLNASRGGGAPADQQADTDLTEGGNYGRLKLDKASGEYVTELPAAKDDGEIVSQTTNANGGTLTVKRSARPPGIVGRSVKSTGDGTKDAPYKPKTVDDLKSLKAGESYINPADGKAYTFHGLPPALAR